MSNVFQPTARYVSIGTLARMFDVSHRTIWRWVAEKGFPTPRLADGRKYRRWDRLEVERWIEATLAVERKVM